jgi:phosphatidylglycerol:prolipoprotein diacylglycerol transferase
MFLTPPTLAAWLHDLNPVLVRFTDTFAIRYYGLAYAIGFLLGWAWLRFMSRRGMTPLSPQRISDMMVAMVLGVVAGGRIGYVLFYDPSLLTDFNSSFPFWGVLRLNQGGMSSHGGILGVMIATWWVSRGVKDEQGRVQFRVPWMHVLDLAAVACTAGLMLGRIANFINGELLGKIVAAPGEPAPWWAVKFPQERATYDPAAAVEHAPALSPEQTEQFRNLLDQFRVGMESDQTAYQRVLHVLQSGGVEAEAVARQLSPLIAARFPSQLLQAATDGLVLGGILWLIWAKPRRAGVISAWFGIIYGVLRILTEQVRLPDAALQNVKASTGLSMGQWLSVGMVAIGAAMLAVFIRRPGPVFGGWLRRA